MKTILSLCCLSFLLLNQVESATLKVPTRTFTSEPTIRRRVTLNLTEAGPVTAPPWLIAGDSVAAMTDADGCAWFTNVLAAKYTLNISGTPGRTFPLGVYDTNGIINAADIVNNTNINTAYYTVPQVDALLAGVTAGSASGETNLNASVGAGASLVAGKAGRTNQLKSLIGSANVTLTETDTNLTLSLPATISSHTTGNAATATTATNAVNSTNLYPAAPLSVNFLGGTLTSGGTTLSPSGVNTTVGGITPTSIHSTNFEGNGLLVTNIPGSSITGSLSNNTTGNAATATTATTATTAATATLATTAGNLTPGITANPFDGNAISNLNAAKLTGGPVTNAINTPSVTVVNLNALNVSGNGSGLTDLNVAPTIGSGYDTNYLEGFNSLLSSIKSGSNVQVSVMLISDSYGAHGVWTVPAFTALKRAYGDAGEFLYIYSGQTPALPSPGYDYSRILPSNIGSDLGFYATGSRPLFTFTGVTNSGNTVTWAGVQTATNIFYYFRHAGGGTFSITTNGVPFTVIDASGTASLQSTNIIVPAGVYTIGYSNVTGTNFFCGVDVRRANPGLRFYNHGHSSASAIDWASASMFGDTAVFEKVLTNENPNLVIIDLGRNDMLVDGPSGVTALAGNLQTIINRARAFTTNQAMIADYALVVSSDLTNDLNAAVSADLVAPIVNVAQTNKIKVVNLYAALPPEAQMRSRGLFFDTYHLNAAGGRAYGDAVSAALFGAKMDVISAAGKPIWQQEYSPSYLFGIGGTSRDAGAGQAFVRDSIEVASGAVSTPVFKIPNGLGFKQTVTTFVLGGASGCTNMSGAIQNVAEYYNPVYNSAGTSFADFTGLTNRQQITVTFTNTWPDDVNPRSLYTRMMDLSHSGNITNIILINRIYIRSLP